MKQITRQQAWSIFHSAPLEKSVWEHTEADTEYIARYGRPGGLLLAVCPHCGAQQTRETYCGGFWAENIELVTDYTCSGIARCRCGQWSKWIH